MLWNQELQMNMNQSEWNDSDELSQSTRGSIFIKAKLICYIEMKKLESIKWNKYIQFDQKRKGNQSLHQIHIVYRPANLLFICSFLLINFLSPEHSFNREWRVSDYNQETSQHTIRFIIKRYILWINTKPNDVMSAEYIVWFVPVKLADKATKPTWSQLVDKP